MRDMPPDQRLLAPTLGKNGGIPDDEPILIHPNLNGRRHGVVPMHERVYQRSTQRSLLMLNDLFTTLYTPPYPPNPSRGSQRKCTLRRRLIRPYSYART